MAGKKKSDATEKTIKGDMPLKSVDGLMAMFRMSANEKIRSNLNVSLDPNILPSDYDPGKYDVTGEYTFKVTITERK